jgi:hypothetical protein
MFCFSIIALDFSFISGKNSGISNILDFDSFIFAADDNTGLVVVVVVADVVVLKDVVVLAVVVVVGHLWVLQAS